MPISVTNLLAGPFTPNGATTQFSFSFGANAASDVVVYDQDFAVVSSALYTVALNAGEGGTVTFSTAPTASQYTSLYIALDPAYGQASDFTNGGDTYDPATLTEALDALALQILANKEGSDRSLKVARGEVGPEFPTVDTRKNKVLGFDSAGNPEMVTPDYTFTGAPTGDGYLYDAITGTRFRYTVRDGQAVLAHAPHVFIDAENGNDAWDGNRKTHDGGTSGPKKTEAAVDAHPAMVANATDDTPVTIGIVHPASGGPARVGFDYYTASSRNGNMTRNNVTFVGVGAPLVKMSCCDVVSKASFTAHATIANAYEVTVPHEMLDSSGANYTSLFINGERQCKQVANEADVATAGTWWAANGGRADAGVNLRIVVHFQGSVAPTSVVGDIEVTTRTTAVAGFDNCRVEGVHGFGNGSNNGSIVFNNYCTARRWLAEEGSKHNALFSPCGADIQDGYVINCTRSDDAAPHAARNLLVSYGFGVNFVEGCTGGKFTRVFGLTDASYMTYSDGGAGGAQFFYCHASGYVGSFDLIDCGDSGMFLGSGSESGTVNLKRYVSYSNLQANTPVFTTSAPTGIVNCEDGFLFGSCNQRAFDAYEVNFKRNAALGNYGWLVYYSKKFVIEDNIAIAPPGGFMSVYVGPGDLLVSGKVNNNVFGDLSPAFHFHNAAPGAKLIANHNVYSYLTGGGGQNFSEVAFAAQAALFSDWQALGNDVAGSALSSTSTAAIAAWFASGVRPTSVNLDPVLAPGSAPYQAVRERVNLTKLQEARDMARTRAAALNRLTTETEVTHVLELAA